MNVGLHTSVGGLRVRDASVHPVLGAGDHFVASDLAGRSGSSLNAALKVSGAIAVVARVRSSALGVAEGSLHASSGAVAGLARRVVAALDVLASRTQIGRVESSSAASRRSGNAHTFDAIGVARSLHRATGI